MQYHPMYFRMDGTPYEGENPVLQWGKDFENVAARRIGDAKLPNGYRVSTVWLGLDHNHWGGPPLIFETMVFPIDSFDELQTERYSTLKEAKAGHERMVEEWSKKPPR